MLYRLHVGGIHIYDASSKMDWTVGSAGTVEIEAILHGLIIEAVIHCCRVNGAVIEWSVTCSTGDCVILPVGAIHHDIVFARESRT